MHVVVGRAHIGGIGIGQPPLLRSHIDAIAGHHVVTTRLEGTDTLREDKGLIGEVLGYIFPRRSLPYFNKCSEGSFLSLYILFATRALNKQ